MGGKGIAVCRVWWPKHLSLRPAQHLLLFGWATHFSDSLDLVVAAACCCSIGPTSSSQIKAMFNNASDCLPTNLREKAALSIIGECLPSDEHYPERFSRSRQDQIDNYAVQERSMCTEKFLGCIHMQNKTWNCNCELITRHRNLKSVSQIPRKRQNGLVAGIKYTLDEFHVAAELANIWIELEAQLAFKNSKGLNWVPRMKILHFEDTVCMPDVHVILYEQPRFLSHHFSLSPWNFVPSSKAHDNISRGLAKCLSKPQWVSDIEKQREALDIELVILQLNCAATVEQAIEDIFVSVDTSCKRLSLSSMLSFLCRHLLAATVALSATVFYILIQAGSCTLSAWPFLVVSTTCTKLMKHTSYNLHIRCHQLTGWPVILTGRGCWRDQPNVECAHTAALERHSVWLSVIFDLFFGMLAGVLLIAYHASISQWVRSIVRSLTDDILRTGCIWLMGVPAGFKLNTELAGTLGLLSLNVIQVWSTLLYFLKPAFGPFLYVLAIAGILLGATVPAAIMVDVLFWATIHISILHKIVAFLYSNQLQALASLWRLFRGWKRNYLRRRIDTYDYTVEQHIVGSLMFTPLLLLLPTTSVFYIYFTILYTSMSILRFLLQVLIALIHCIPYAQVVIWLVQPQRFPSGIWFETLYLRTQELNAHVDGSACPNQSVRHSESSNSLYRKNHVSALGNKTASLGQLLSTYLRQVGGGVSWSSCASFIYKIFSGERWPVSLEFGAPTIPPWITISIRRFWWLCYDSVVASL